MLLLLGALPIAIWSYLLLGRGQFWRVARHLSRTAPTVSTRKNVAVVIPARDEAETIGATVEALLKQEFSGELSVFVVDDNSADSTGALAGHAGAIVIEGTPLPPGWTGKLWALSQGLAAAEKLRPDFFLLTDADILHGRQSVTELVGLAEAGDYDLTSFMVKLACNTTAERALIPAFVFFFLMLYPPAWTGSAARKTAGAAGGCILIRPEALRKIGGIAAIRGAVIDDCALAKAVKRSGGCVWLGLTRERTSERAYTGWREIEQMVARTAFNQLGHSALLLAGTLLGLLVTYVLPILLLASGRPGFMLEGGLAWMLMAVAYRPMIAFYDLNPTWSFALPAIATFYSGATVHSAWRFWFRRGGQWKGRSQDAR